MLSSRAGTARKMFGRFYACGAIAVVVLTIAASASFQQQLGVMDAPACAHTKLHTVEGSVHLHQQH